MASTAARRRIVLEQRQTRRDVFRAPKSWPVRPGQIERADPKLIGDGAHEHRAIARKPVQPARIERRLSACLVAVGQFLRGDSETAQNRPIVRLRAMQPADPEPRDIRRDWNTRRLSVRAIPGHIQTPARAPCARPSAPCRRQERACKNPKKRESKNPAFRLFRQRDKARVGQRHRLIRRSFRQRRAAKRGARLVDGRNAFRCIARKDRLLRRGIGFVSLAPDEFEVGRIEFGCQNVVDKRLRPGEDRRQALLLGQLLLGLGGGPVDRLGESLGRDRESKADDAREPFVERPLEFWAPLSG